MTGQIPRWPPLPRLLLLSGVLFVTAAAGRLLALLEGGFRPESCDLRGLADDLAASLVVVALTALASRMRWWIALPLPLFFALVGLGNYEHVRALDAPLLVSHASMLLDPVFVRGSVLHLTHPLASALGLGVILVAAVASLKGIFVPLPQRIGWLLVAGIGLATSFSLPVHPTCLAWRQVHPLSRLLVSSRPSTPGPGAGSSLDAAALAAGSSLAADLTGQRWTPPAPSGTNVLLIVLESVSGAYLPSLAAEQGLESEIAMQHLDGILSTGVRIPRFFTQQRETQRGEYALLCGDLPKLSRVTPRFSELDRDWPHPCLPEILRNEGYATVYLQAAPLAFMMKDQALPVAGFERVLGDGFFEAAEVRSKWGIDDRSFLEQSLELIQEVDDGDRPWFVTLLNVGTHHPFVVPESFEKEWSDRYAPGDPALPFLFLDEALSAFWSELENRGVLRDTLVVLASDESRGLEGGGPDSARLLAQNWGVGFLHSPLGVRRAMDQPFAQNDVALSILDHLDLASKSTALTGRSVFRDYPTPRAVFFGNAYQDSVSGLFPPLSLVRCQRGFESCRTLELDSARPFGGPPVEGESDPERIATLQGAVAWSERGPARRLPAPIQLVPPGAIELLGAGSYQLLFGGQKVDVEAGDEVEVELVFEVLEGDPARVHLRHDLTSTEGERFYLADLPTLADGESARLRYRIRFASSARGLNCLGTINVLSGDHPSVRFERARWTIRPDSGASPPPSHHEVEVLERALHRSSEPPTLVWTQADIRPGDRHSCLDSEWKATDCPRGLLLEGPQAYAPLGSTVSATLEVEGLQGAGSLQLIGGSPQAGVVVLSGRPVEVRAGESSTVRLEGEIQAALNEFRLGTLWQSNQASTTFRLRSVELEVQLP